jgi:hypothetical protein
MPIHRRDVARPVMSSRTGTIGAGSHVALDLRHREGDLGARFVAVSSSPTPAALRTDPAAIRTLGKGDPSRSPSSLPAIPHRCRWRARPPRLSQWSRAEGASRWDRGKWSRRAFLRGRGQGRTLTAPRTRRFCRRSVTTRRNLRLGFAHVPLVRSVVREQGFAL